MHLCQQMLTCPKLKLFFALINWTRERIVCYILVCRETDLLYLHSLLLCICKSSDTTNNHVSNILSVCKTWGEIFLSSCCSSLWVPFRLPLAQGVRITLCMTNLQVISFWHPIQCVNEVYLCIVIVSASSLLGTYHHLYNFTISCHGISCFDCISCAGSFE